MPERLIDTHFPGQQFPVGSVVTFLDRHRRAVFGTVTELRRHEAIVAGGEAGRWRVQYAGLKLIKAGPTGGATMQQVEDHAAQLLERHLNTRAPATWWRFRFETATSRAGICAEPHLDEERGLAVVVRRTPWKLAVNGVRAVPWPAPSPSTGVRPTCISPRGQRRPGLPAGRW